MTEVKWIKLDVGVFDNRKVKQIRALPEGDSLLVIWLQLLCLAGTINDNGRIYLTEEIPYTDQMLRNFLQEPLATVQLALQTFENLGMIEVEDDIIYIANWAKYQNQEDLERLREQGRKRVRNYRARQKEIECNANVTLQKRYNTVTCNALEEERRKEKEDRREKKEDIPFLRKKENKKIYEEVKELIKTELLKRELFQEEENDLRNMVDNYEEKDIIHGIREAVIYNKPSLAYVYAIAKKRNEERK